jgi:signal transduction histidine kinase
MLLIAMAAFTGLMVVLYAASLIGATAVWISLLMIGASSVAGLWQEKSARSRLDDLNESVKKIGLGGNVSARVEMKGQDQATRLAGAINEMLEALERSQQQTEQEIHRLNETLERHAREMDALRRAGQVMTSSLNPETVLKMVTDEIRNLLDVEGASVLLRDPTSDEMIFAATTGPASASLINRRMPITAGIAGWVIRERKSIVVNDAQHDPRLFGQIDQTTSMTTRSLVAVPVRFKGAVWGVVEAINKRTGDLDEHDLEMLEALASSAAIAIENAQLYATEQHRAAALARALEQQRELDRLQREFIQNVSHELRTPLTIANGHAELLESGEFGDLTESQRGAAKIILQRTRMLSHLVSDITAILELETRELSRQPVHLDPLVREVEDEFRVTASRAKVSFVVEIAPDIHPVLGDTMSLRRLFDNLLSNAFKFTPAGGRVTVRLRQEQAAIVLKVTDTGAGIPQDHLGRIFDRFYQVDGSTTRRYGGVGLGLALVKQIVQAHEGTISVTSEVNVGSTFTVQLPIAT